MKKRFIVLFLAVFTLGACSSEEVKQSEEVVISTENETGSQSSKGQNAEIVSATNLDYAYTPERQLAGFSVPEGFRVELVASEREGVIWVQTATMYPLDGVEEDVKFLEVLQIMQDPSKQVGGRFKTILDYYQGVTPGDDRILVFSDPHASEPSAPIVWAEGLAIPQSILPYKTGAIVAQGSEMFFLDDTNGDGVSDTRVPMLTGFGFTDSHTLPHTLVRGPGGWVHFSQGALNSGKVKSVVSGAELDVDYSKIVRMSLDGREMEIAASGLNNIWGFMLRGNGQWYGSEANDRGYSATPIEVNTGFPGIGDESVRSYQPWFPSIHEFRVGGTGISAMAFADDISGSFPDEWKDIALLANPITRTINSVRVERRPDGTVISEHLPDFLSSDDPQFRPVNMEFGPDGCLYVVDWYNKIISHNEVQRDHPDRDRGHGRLWRVCHENSSPNPQIANLYEVDSARLVEHLLAPSIWEQRAAWHQIVDRQALELAPALKQLVVDSSINVTSRIHALWALEGIKHYDENVMMALLSSSDDELRREAVRALAGMPMSVEQLVKHLRPLRDDPNVMVQSQLIRTLREFGRANNDVIDLLVHFGKDDIDGVELGGSYERKFERFLVRMALEQYTDELTIYLASAAPQDQPANNLLWAVQAFSEPSLRQEWFLRLWPQLGDAFLDKANFIVIADASLNDDVADMIRPSFENTANALKLATYAQETYTQTQSEQMSYLLQPALDYLLLTGDQNELTLALDVATKFSVSGLGDTVHQVLNTQNVNDETIRMMINLLAQDMDANESVLTFLLEQDSLIIGLRIHLLTQFANTDLPFVEKELESRMTDMSEADIRSVVNAFRSNRAGALALLNLLEKTVLTFDHFDLPAGRSVANLHSEDPRALELLAVIEAREKEEQEGMAARIEHLIALAEKQGGNAEAGKPLFTGLCLSCHEVGDEGQDFAPALDGSGHRDNEGLITAIVNPNASYESGYRLYRVQRKDGSIVEGYRASRTRQGIRLRFMGGGDLFIPIGDVEDQHYVDGQSVMPKGLIDYLGEPQIEDLLAYIRTLK